jgi:hypothetical protein
MLEAAHQHVHRHDLIYVKALLCFVTRCRLRRLLRACILKRPDYAYRLTRAIALYPAKASHMTRFSRQTNAELRHSILSRLHQWPETAPCPAAVLRVNQLQQLFPGW